MPSGMLDLGGPRFGVDVGRDGVEADGPELVGPEAEVGGSLTPCARATEPQIAKWSAAAATIIRMVNSGRQWGGTTFACQLSDAGDVPTRLRTHHGF